MNDKGLVNPDADYCNDLYTLGMLDLMFCAYVIADHQGASQAKTIWKTAILNYLKTPADTDPGIRISLQVGVIVNGKDGSSDNYYFTFASCNDLVTKSYSLSNSFSAVDSTSDKTLKDTKKPKDATKSVNKPFSGYFGIDGINPSEKNDNGNKWFAGTSLNGSVTVKTSDDKGKNLTGSAKTTFQTYQDYYTRLKAAVKANGKDYTTGLAWYSSNSLVWVLGKVYKKDGSESYSMASYIELLRSRNTGADEKGGYNEFVDESYGGGYYTAHGWRPTVADPGYSIGARLEVSSSYYSKYFNKDKTYWAGPDFSKYVADTDYITAENNGAQYAIGKDPDASASIVINTKKEGAGM
jgi:hypothetical protein